MLCEAAFDDNWLANMHLNLTVIAGHINGFVRVLAASHRVHLLSRHVLLLIVVVILLLLATIAVLKLNKAS